MGHGLPPLQDLGGQRQPAEEAQQSRDGTQNCLVRLLRVPSGWLFHAQIGARRLNSHLHRTAAQLPDQDLGRYEGGVGAEQGL